jgi:nucleoside permease NupC
MSSVGIQVGVLGALCKSKQAQVARIAFGAMLTGTVTEMLGNTFYNTLVRHVL